MVPGPRHRQRQGPPRHQMPLVLLLLLLLPAAIHAFHLPSLAHTKSSRAAPLKAAAAAATSVPALDGPRNGTEGGGCPFHATGKTGVRACAE